MNPTRRTDYNTSGDPFPAEDTLVAKSDPGDRWVALTWDDLESWAGVRAVQKGRSYQRGGHVRDLARTADGALLATVQGTHTYATTVSVGGKSGTRLDSQCSCPIGGTCKHCVAVVAAYLDAVAHGRPVPVASEDDPRWERLDGDEDEWEEEDEYGEYEPTLTRNPRTPKAAKGTPADAEIRRSLGEMSQGELADLAWSLISRSPATLREYRDRIALQSGDVKQLLSEARKELRHATAEFGWRNSWTGEGHTPDYARIRSLLERLLALGRADDVVSLGRELIDKGMEQVGGSDDEGETATEVQSCMPVVFAAVLKSKLSPADRLLFAIDAVLKDDYDLIGEATEQVLDAPASREDWGKVADALTARLAAPPRGEDSFTSKYDRERIGDWVGRALAKAGRADQLTSLYEAEARATGSYDRLVEHLIAAGRTDDAARWAEEGIAATAVQYPGIADGLAAKMCDLARARKDWPVVAAHAARDFFRRPHASGLDDLAEAAKRAKVEQPVRAAALRFLETGVRPYTVAVPELPRRGKPAPPASTAVKPAGRRAAPEPAFRVTVSPDWPLPVPEYLLPLEVPRGGFREPERPHFDVLIDMAIRAKQPERVLHWYDASRAGRTGRGGYADRVAEAVADAFPERALQIYRAGLDAQLPNTGDSAYQAAAEYLKKMRPLYDALGTPAEWAALVAGLREKYARRRLFLERLDRLESKPIAQLPRKKPQ